MALPVLRYTGRTHLVTDAADLSRAARAIERERVVGFDTETRPTFRKGQNHLPSLVQIATSRSVYLFQLARLDCSRALAEVFGDVRIVKAGVAIGRDLTDLQKIFQFRPANILDLGDVAARHGLKQTGMRNLAGLFLGGRVAKGARTTNWARPELTAAQLCYAATDAWVCRELYLRFEKLGWLTRP